MRPATPSDPAKRTVQLAAGSVAYVDEGDGPCIMAIHGLPGSSRDFRWLAPCVSDSLRLVRLDLPGFGETPAHLCDPTPDAQARFVVATIEALELDRVVLLGHSFGGVVAAAAALDSDRVSGLALIASPGLQEHVGFVRARPIRRPIVGRLLGIPVVQRAMAPLTRAMFRKAGFPPRYRDDELVRTIQSISAVSMPAHAARLRQTVLPTLVAYCKDDRLVEPAIGDELANAMPAGPRLRFADGGHNPQAAHAVELGEALVTWVKALS